MSIKADCHLHSSFSGDSQAPMPEMIDKGLALGLETMCFTEHNDFDYPRTEEGPGTIFLLNTDSYLYDVLRSARNMKGKCGSSSAWSWDCSLIWPTATKILFPPMILISSSAPLISVKEWIPIIRNISRNSPPRKKPSGLILQRHWRI